MADQGSAAMIGTERLAIESYSHRTTNVLAAIGPECSVELEIEENEQPGAGVNLRGRGLRLVGTLDDERGARFEIDDLRMLQALGSALLRAHAMAVKKRAARAGDR